MNPNEVDLVVTDPPYNVAYEGNGKTIQNDDMSNDEFKEFLSSCFACMSDVMKAGAPFYVWHASREQMNFEKALNNAGLKVRQQLIWNKSSLILGRQDYQWKHEPCFYGWKDGAAHYFKDSRVETTVIEDKPNINKMSKQELKEYIKELLRNIPASTVIEEDKPSRNGEHPTMKPVRLIGYQIQNSSKKNDIVLDLFGGSGTTLIACEQLNRRCRTMELDEKYASVILQRWKNLTGKEGIRI